MSNLKYSNDDLKQIARDIRVDIIRSITAAGSGHTGGSLGLADIFTALYFRIMNHDPLQPEWNARDRLILSIGHVAPVLYTTLAHCGYFPKEELISLRKLGSRLQGHPGREHKLPGIELSAGSLGQGLSVAAGLALAGKIRMADYHVYCILGDGELQEGSIWEAAMSAAHHRLINLTAIVDRNRLQIDGKTSDVMEIEPLEEKWRSFGWDTFSCNGNSISDVIDTLTNKAINRNKPVVIIANTTMGKGVPEIENNPAWHGKAPDKEQEERFISQLYL